MKILFTFFIMLLFNYAYSQSQQKILKNNTYTIASNIINSIQVLPTGSLIKLKLNDSTFIELKINMNVVHNYNLRSIGATLVGVDSSFFNLTFYQINGKIIYEGLLYFKNIKQGYILSNTLTNDLFFKKEENSSIIVDN